MIQSSGTIFISTKMPDGKIRKTAVPKADNYFVDASVNPPVVKPITNYQSPITHNPSPIAKLQSPVQPRTTNHEPQSKQYSTQNGRDGLKQMSTQPFVPRPFPRPPIKQTSAHSVPVGFTVKPYTIPDFNVDIPKVIETPKTESVSEIVPESPIPEPIPLPISTQKQSFSSVSADTALRLKARREKRLHAKSRSMPLQAKIGAGILAASLIGMAVPWVNKAYMESYFIAKKASDVVEAAAGPTVSFAALPPAVPVRFNPLITPGGDPIIPYSTHFGLIIPKIGVNAKVLEDVNPASRTEYNKALENAVAHSSTSHTPDETGTVYLFSHDTNYEWFVKSLNAIFYLVKELEVGDYIVVIYRDVRYTYRMTDRRVVKPTDVSYLVPDTSKKNLILQTCWPPGSTTQRLLIFADLVDTQVL